MHFYNRIFFHIRYTIMMTQTGYVIQLGQENGLPIHRIVRQEPQKHRDIPVLLNMYLFRKVYQQILLIVSEIIHETIVL